jgi:hypothetical protein
MLSNPIDAFLALKHYNIRFKWMMEIIRESKERYYRKHHPREIALVDHLGLMVRRMGDEDERRLLHLQKTGPNTYGPDETSGLSTNG